MIHASKLVVSTLKDSPNSIVVLGTENAHEACAAAGITTTTHRWGGSYYYPAGWVAHRDGTASRKHQHEGPNARGRAAVVFLGVHAKESA